MSCNHYTDSSNKSIDIDYLCFYLKMNWGITFLEAEEAILRQLHE